MLPSSCISLAAEVIRLATRKRCWLGTAESCTGGLVAASLTEIAGSSAVVAGGWVSYANAAKHAWLGVPETMLHQHGAVSEAVARAMSLGAAQHIANLHHDERPVLCVSVTGIAGPSGGSAAKPVGTVHLSTTLLSSAQTTTQHQVHLFTGERSAVRTSSTQCALTMLLDALHHLPDMLGE